MLENVTSIKELRDVIKCPELFTSIKELFTQHPSDKANKKSLINIMFNLNFNMSHPHDLGKEFLTQLFSMYSNSWEEDKTQSPIQRKMISIVVVASALEGNHLNIIDSNFYTQFKRNINDDYATMVAKNEEIELFGLVNIALNKRLMNKIYPDLKKIHKIAIKNDKIDFKTKVDMFVEISKYVARLS